MSSSPEEVVRPLAEHFGDVSVIATRARIEDGKYTGELEFYCAGEGKAEAIREAVVDTARRRLYEIAAADAARVGADEGDRREVAAVQALME